MTSFVQTTNTTTTITLASDDSIEIIPGVSVAVSTSSYGIEATAGEATASVDGSLFGDAGFFDTSDTGSDHISVGSQGSISALGVDVSASGDGNYLANLGTLSSSEGSGIEFGSGNTIVNSGTISVWNYDITDEGGDSITNSGTIEQEYYLNQTINETSGNNNIDNSGTISSDASPTNLYNIYLNGGDNTISNSGLIQGGQTSVYCADGMDSLANSGTISGLGDVIDIAGALGQNTISNFGLIVSRQSQWAITISGGDDSISNDGTISGGATGGAIAIDSATSASTLTNSGTINGGVSISGPGSSLVDSGSIQGSVEFDGGATGLTEVTIAHTGAIMSGAGLDALTIGAGAYDIKNSGDIIGAQNGAVIGAPNGIEVLGAGSITNDGKIEGVFAGVHNTDPNSGDASYLYNYGVISGTVFGVRDTGGHSDDIFNYGHIDGGPTGDAIYADANSYDYVFNRGTISGSGAAGLAGFWNCQFRHDRRRGRTDVLGRDHQFRRDQPDFRRQFRDGIVAQEFRRHRFDRQLQRQSASSSTIREPSTARRPSTGPAPRSSTPASIAGGVSFGGGAEQFINNGTVIGNVTFDGTDNAYDGADGSVTGEIIASGTTGTYIGGAGADTFVFTASGLGAGDTVQGGGGSNTLKFSTAGTISATALGNVSGIETIDLANGTNSIKLTNALVSSANGATLTVNGGTGADTINASAVSTATDNADHRRRRRGGHDRRRRARSTPSSTRARAIRPARAYDTDLRRQFRPRLLRGSRRAGDDQDDQRRGDGLAVDGDLQHRPRHRARRDPTRRA